MQDTFVDRLFAFAWLVIKTTFFHFLGFVYMLDFGCGLISAHRRTTTTDQPLVITPTA
jgi:hypothetical protein